MRIVVDERIVDLYDNGKPTIGAHVLASGLLDCTYELHRDPDGPGGVLGPKVGAAETIVVREGDRFVCTPRCTGFGVDD